MQWTMMVLLFAFATTISPGPNNIMIMSSGVNFGFKRSLPHLLGIALGFPLMLLAVGLGLSVLFEQFSQLYRVIQFIGIAYLLYLAYLLSKAQQIQQDGIASQPLTFIQAAAFQWVNPKAWVMATGALTAFTDSEQFLWQVCLMTGIFFLVAVVCVSTWLVFGIILAKLLQHPKHRQRFNLAMALLLVISIIPSMIDLVYSVI